MIEVKNNSVHLIVTSPPYPMHTMWDKQFKESNCLDYNTMHNYLDQTWKECYRVLCEGGIICINIGDVTRRWYNQFQVFPNHSEIIQRMSKIGFTVLPYILWKKISVRKTAFLGSGFIPPNSYVTMDCEYILIFRKGNLRSMTPEAKKLSKYSMENRNKWFSQIWEIPGAKQVSIKSRKHSAEFPEEIPRRLIQMFSGVDEIILDPFLGTGTTAKVALSLNRKVIGYEKELSLKEIISTKINIEIL
jgi:site-specific DNA-methyltransferase (cytosine-N4-specific)